MGALPGRILIDYRDIFVKAKSQKKPSWTLAAEGAHRQVFPMKKTGHGETSLAQAYDELKAEKIHIQATLSDRCHRLVLESDEKDGEVAVCALHVPSTGAARNKDTHTHTSSLDSHRIPVI